MGFDGKNNNWQTSVLKLLFNNTADTTAGYIGSGLQAAVTPGSLYISLHTADPTAAGGQTSSETTYTNYLRVGVVRSSAGWTISGSSPAQAANAAAITFAQCGVSGATITYVGIGTASSGSGGALLYSAALTSQLIVSNNITPSFAIGALVVTED